MKKILFVLIFGLFLFSGCVAPDKDNTTVTELKSLERPDSPNDWEYVMKDTTGKFSVLKNGGYIEVDSTWQVQAKIPLSTFQVQMGSEQVKKFLTLSNYFETNLIVGIILMLILFSTVIWALARNGWSVEKYSFGTAALFVLALGFCIRTIQEKPSELSDNNKKSLTRSEYELIKKTDPTFDAFWQKQWEENNLVGLNNDK